MASKYLSVVICAIAAVQCTALVIKPGISSKNTDHHHLSKRQAADTSDVDYSQFKPIQGPTEKPITIMELPKGQSTGQSSQPSIYNFNTGQHIQEESSVDGREIQNENGFSSNPNPIPVTPRYQQRVSWNRESSQHNFEAKPNGPGRFGEVPNYWNPYDTPNGLNIPPPPSASEAYRRHMEIVNRNRFGIPPPNDFTFSTSFNNPHHPAMQNNIRSGFFPNNDGFHSEHYYDSTSNGNGNGELRRYLINTFSSSNPEIHQIIDRLNI